MIHFISLQDPDIKIDNPSSINSLIHLVETNTYDCIIAPDKIGVLNNLELTQKVAEIASTPILRYSSESSLYIPTESNPERSEGQKRDDVLSYSLLATRIRNTVKQGKRRGPVINLNLPELPYVKIKGNEIIIVKEGGSEEYWGNEPDETIHEIARLMELELKMIQWVRMELLRLIGEITETIKETEVPQSDISDIIYEGYRSLLTQFKKIDQSYNQR